MRKINLRSRELSSSHYNHGSNVAPIVIGVIILLVTALLYGGVFLIKKSQDKQKSRLKQSIASIKRELDTNKNFQDLYDFQKRLMSIGAMLDTKIVQTNILNSLSENTLGETTLTDLKITEKNNLSEIALQGNVKDLAILAKQINAYNNLDDNGQAILIKSALKDENNKNNQNNEEDQKIVLEFDVALKVDGKKNDKLVKTSVDKTIPQEIQ